MNEEKKKIKKILVEGVGWVYSMFSDNTSADGKTAPEPIEVFMVNGEMSLVAWYKKGKDEFNGKYVIQVVYE